MKRKRAVSPIGSDNGVDIAKLLAVEDSDDEETSHPTPLLKKPQSEAVIPDLLEVGDDENDDEDFIQSTQSALNRKSSALKGRTVRKGGGFQAMGLNANLLKAITRKGFSVPTPIQRKTVPIILEGQDVVGMARTGSGKTAAFVIPMIERLKAHSVKVGARALVMSPSRELALQTLKVVKELGKGTDLKCVLLVGGDSLEEQFGFMAENPDIVIATPGRFLHLKVEMNLDLSSIKYLVFDEADRLFEMGFAAQLTEILHALPTSRQTLLFSATLPKSLVEFARAGLQDPQLIRLDAESKISADLQSAFFSVKPAEKEGALLHILHDLIKMPTGETVAAKKARESSGAKNGKKRKRDDNVKPNEIPTEHSTIIFAATKHHVDYLASMLRLAGFAVSFVYGALDQTARKIQVQNFRAGLTNILVVTDVAARGIDIPVLANVINYDFPAQAKIFVHRVGRTARAGQKGWSYSIVQDGDVPYLLDLQLFLGKRLIIGRKAAEGASFTDDVVVGGLARDKISPNSEWVVKMLEEDADLEASRSVATKGERLYLCTRNSASAESAKRAKEVVANPGWSEIHAVFEDAGRDLETERENMLARISGFRPSETIFEIGPKNSQSETGEVVRRRREKLKQQQAKKARVAAMSAEKASDSDEGDVSPPVPPIFSDEEVDVADYDANDEDDDGLEVIVTNNTDEGKKQPRKTGQDSDFFMGYTPTTINQAEEKGYGVHSGSYAATSSSFVKEARNVTMDFNNDEGTKSFGEASRAKGMRWDKKARKYVARANDEDGSRGAKMIVGESGAKIAASFRSGRFEDWKRANRVERMPRVGELEKASNTGPGQSGFNSKRYRHKTVKAPKEADRFRDDYHKQKKLVEAAKEKRIGRFAEPKSELKSHEAVRKARRLKERRRERTARPSKKKK